MRLCLPALRECLYKTNMELFVNLLCRISALVICCILVYRCKLPWRWFYITIIALHFGLVVRSAVNVVSPNADSLDSFLMLFNSVTDVLCMLSLLYYTREYFNLQHKYCDRSGEYVASLYLTKLQKEFIQDKTEKKDA